MIDLPRSVLLEAGLVLKNGDADESEPRKPKWMPIWTPQYYAQTAHNKDAMRRQVLYRDRARCAFCRIDCEALRDCLEFVKMSCANHRLGFDFHFADFRRAVGHQRTWRFPRSLWDADMILPKSQGGKEVLENFRTLCLLCHRKETNRLIYGKG